MGGPRKSPQTDALKITAIQIHEAFARAVLGESVRSLARGLGVDESTLREHFKKGGKTPRQIREIAFQLFYAEQAQNRLDDDGRRRVAAIIRREKKRVKC
jgi:hypothetical protein